MNIMQYFKSFLGKMTDEDLEKRYVKKNKLNPVYSRNTGGWKKRGTGYTRRRHEESKVRRKMAKNSRRINRLRA